MSKKNLFNAVKMTQTPSNVFDLSHDVKLSGKMGNLIPTLVMEVVPGDLLGISCESLLRFAPLLAPIMHRVDVTMHYFFCPNRLLWPNWEKFITNTKIGGVPGALPVPPFMTAGVGDAGGWEGTLPDYLGLPPAPAGNPNQIKFSALPFAAYQKIYDEYYRDQNLINSIWVDLTDGNNNPQAAMLWALRKRAWEHDYFTAALPFAQKGDSVDIPLGDVELKPGFPRSPHIIKRASDGLVPAAGDVVTDAQGDLAWDNGAINWEAVIDPNGQWQVDATTINDLRLAFRLQEFLEKNARGGTRYIENILAHFGVRSSDKRLQRPEYITGVKTPVQISEVLNTTGTATAPQGNMAGHGAAVTTGNYGRFFVEEHGFVIGIMSVMPKTAYQDGIPKHFTRLDDPTEYYFPSFAHIGEQEVKNKEIYGWQAAQEGTFGYVPRYAEYKFMSNRVAGDFRSTLAHWHMGRKFNAAPALNQTFVECDATNRIFAVQDETDNLWCQVYHKIKAIRRMPKFGTPTF